MSYDKSRICTEYPAVIKNIHLKNPSKNVTTKNVTNKNVTTKPKKEFTGKFKLFKDDSKSKFLAISSSKEIFVFNIRNDTCLMEKFMSVSKEFEV